jgi:hypothetical protein
MALAELTAQLACLYGPAAPTAQTDFVALGGRGSAACAAGPSFPPGVARPAPAARWIASELPPALVQPWPPGVPVPAGWREVDAMEAHRLQGKPTITIAGGLRGLPDASRLAALSTADSSADVIADRRPGRTPREARFARVSRFPRLPRAARLPRPARAPRPARRPRLKRPPRAKRTSRPRRPPFTKTKYERGQCKRPSCTCWTPGGCIGGSLWELYKQTGLPAACPDSFPGPCYDYVACITHQCVSDVACAVHQILRFWVRQYHAAVTYVEPRVAPVTDAAQVLARRTFGALTLAVSDTVAPTTPGGGVAGGCPPGMCWRRGLTGVGCQPAAHGTPCLTRDQVIALIGYDPGPI